MKASTFLIAAIVAGLVAGTAFATAQLPGGQTGPRVNKPVTTLGYEPVPTFCDSSPDHGTSTSCKEEAEAQNFQCSNGRPPTSVRCSVGQTCTEGNPPQTGHYCVCKATCGRAIKR